jgi:hypothetical protein
MRRQRGLGGSKAGATRRKKCFLKTKKKLLSAVFYFPSGHFGISQKNIQLHKTPDSGE